jgi:hypothetical protein
MSRLPYRFWLALVSIAIGVPTALAQQQADSQSNPPIPAYHSPLAGVDNDADDNSSARDQQLRPDTRPLAGAQDLSLGVPPETHSYWQPHADITATVGSNALSANNQSGWATYTSLLGGIDLHRMSGNSNLTLSYVGGGTLTNNGSIGNSVTQELTASEKLSFHRSVFSFFEDLLYVPETSFGYGGLGGIALPGGGSTGLQNPFLPGQSILTVRGQRLSNSFIAEDDIHLTSKSSLTFVGGYSLLHYFDNALLDFGDIIFQGGYNHTLTREDTIAVFYRFSGYRYSNFNQSINDNSVQVSYGRRVTGRLAFRVAGGPDVASFAVPITSGAGGTTTNSTTQFYFTLNTSLNYQLKRTNLGLAYNHGLSGGSGVLAGSKLDTVSGSVTRQLSRSFSGVWNLGYARNEGRLVAGGTAAPTTQTFDYWFTGVHIGHPLGRTINLFLYYELQYQNSNSAFCLGTTCNTSYVRNQISFGLGWRKQPIPF